MKSVGLVVLSALVVAMARSSRRIAVVLAASLLVVTTSVSHASVVTESYTFSFSDFVAEDFPETAPFDPWTGSFTVTYDPSVFGVTGSLDAFSSNLGPAYDTFVWGNYSGIGLVIGDQCDAFNCLTTGGTHTAWLVVVPGGIEAAYQTVTDTVDNAFDTSTGGATLVSATPLPSTWSMMLLGIAGVGFMAYRRKSKPALMAA
jgi:PEP-CTERM motif